MFERKTHWIEQELNLIAARFSAEAPHDIELHGSPMRSGKDVWKEHSRDARTQAMLDALGVVRSQHGRNSTQAVRLFGAVIKKSAVSGQDPVDLAFAQLSNRFDLFLQRLYRKHDDAQRGIMLFDKASTEKRIQTLAREFKYAGHKWGTTRNYAEVPVFLDSRASRLIQLADLVAFALYRFYEHNDNTYYQVIARCFDSEGGVEHGLYVHL